MVTKGRLILSEGKPSVGEERGIFVLTVPTGGEDIRIGFLPHDFQHGCVEGAAVFKGFMERQAEPLRLAG